MITFCNYYCYLDYNITYHEKKTCNNKNLSILYGWVPANDARKNFMAYHPYQAFHHVFRIKTIFLSELSWKI